MCELLIHVLGKVCSTRKVCVIRVIVEPKCCFIQSKDDFFIEVKKVWMGEKSIKIYMWDKPRVL